MATNCDPLSSLENLAEVGCLHRSTIHSLQEVANAGLPDDELDSADSGYVTAASSPTTINDGLWLPYDDSPDTILAPFFIVLVPIVHFAFTSLQVYSPRFMAVPMSPSPSSLARKQTRERLCVERSRLLCNNADGRLTAASNQLKKALALTHCNYCHNNHLSFQKVGRRIFPI